MNVHSTLDSGELQALTDTLDDEHKADETHAQVICDFGPVRPFRNIVEAEARHVSALLTLFEKYKAGAPASRRIGKAPRFSSVQEAFLASIQGESENVARSDPALESTDVRTSSPSIRRFAPPRRTGIWPPSSAALSAHLAAAADAHPFITAAVDAALETSIWFGGATYAQATVLLEDPDHGRWYRRPRLSARNFVRGCFGHRAGP